MKTHSNSIPIQILTANKELPQTTEGTFTEGRLAELAEAEAVGAYEIAESLVYKILSHDYSYLPFKDVAPVLKRTLNPDNIDIKERATRLIHTLGDHGMFEYGELLKPKLAE